MNIEPLLLSTTRLATFDGERALTVASGFFFEREGRLFLVTSRHVVIDVPSEHRPDRLEFELHTDPERMTEIVVISLLLYRDGRSVWRQGRDGGGEIDVAVIEVDRAGLPDGAVMRCFTPAHLQQSLHEVEVGTALQVVGFPLGFHDTVHHLPVVRQATIASSFGLRFQGQGYFLTDARTHRGVSGAPVVMRDPRAGADLPWRLLGVHSARMDMSTRDLQIDESLGLNCAWYADILLTLTAPKQPDTLSPPHSAAAERNRAPILAQLQGLLPAHGTALEIAAGTGQHAAHFAAALPGWVWQPTDRDAGRLEAIDAWCHGLPNVRPALQLDVMDADWTAVRDPVDLVYAANLLHIAPWPVCGALMAGAARHLAANGLLVTYGPYLVDGEPTAPSNLAFDADLRRRDPAWGLRRLSDVADQAQAAGLVLRQSVAMPANNRLLVWARAG